MPRSVAVWCDWRSPNPIIASGVGGVAIVARAGVGTTVVTHTLIAVVVRVIGIVLAVVVESDTAMEQ
jgi:hypothetical protein